MAESLCIAGTVGNEPLGVSGEVLLGRLGLLSQRYTKGLDALYLADEPSVF
jgi:hypothetical protein